MNFLQTVSYVKFMFLVAFVVVKSKLKKRLSEISPMRALGHKASSCVGSNSSPGHTKDNPCLITRHGFYLKLS